jgi:alpha/beta superfamily hydrolase
MADHVPATARRLAVRTADGLALRSELAAPEAAVRAAAVLAHPHPLHGGTMHASVIDALFRALPAAGVAALRFNFRGVQGSQGRHGHGRDERLDVAAALGELTGRFPGVPVVLAGWSFGAEVALAVTGESVAGWLAVAPPLRIFAPDELVAGPDPRPVVLVVPAHDQFCPPDAARSRTAGWASTRVEVVPMADHFLAVGVDRVVEVATALVDDLTG